MVLPCVVVNDLTIRPDKGVIDDLQSRVDQCHSG